jgi:hypothetical protein
MLFFMKLLEWAKGNILTWTVGIALFTFFFGPFIQENATGLLRHLFSPSEDVEISVCTPLRNATLLVSSSDGKQTKSHSANHFPFLQRPLVVVFNATDQPIQQSSVFVAPLNISSNFLLGANFYSDNNLSTNDYHVTELPNNAFRIDLGAFAKSQVLVLEFVTLLPTTFVVEFGGLGSSEKHVVNPGTCEEPEPKTISLPVDFFAKDEFPEPSGDSLFGQIEDISDPIGPVRFEVVLDYNCGDGPERQIVPMGGPVQYCDHYINMPNKE